MQHFVLSLCQFSSRQISAALQQLHYPRRCLLPCHRSAAIAGANTVALRQMDAILHKPHGILVPIILDAAPVVRTELPPQKRRAVRLRPLPRIEHRDPLRTAAAVARRVQRLVDDRLRHWAGGEQLTRSLRLRHSIDRRAAAHAKEGHLLRHHRCVLQAQLDLVFAALYEAFGHFREHAPRKNGFRCAGEIAALPHQESVFFGVVANPDFIRAGQHLNPYIVVAVFQKFRACRNIPIGLKIRKNLLPGMLAPTVVQQDRFYEVCI